MEKQQRAIVINDLSGLGKCSLTVSISILSALSIQTCSIPTAILSNQTQFKKYSFYDFTEHMQEYINVWLDNDEQFDAIYSGFLGSDKQIEIIYDLMKNQKNALVIIDPVMGDNKELYDTYTISMCKKMIELISIADIVTPNITEACILADISMDSKEFNKEEIKEIARKIASKGPKYVIITGIINKNEISNVIYEKENDFISYNTFPYYLKSYSGTGDIFSSMLTGLILKGNNVYESVEITSKFLNKAIDYTSQFDTDPNYGIMYERFLKDVL
ncbi:MAG: pyridoxamine kinase [Clostridium sp.]|uniref:pyridoxamine kinase n=1 Tax=Clostridium sp. TaxID=1506 RepID=UPI003F3FDB6E